jgi:hypothetical protein
MAESITPSATEVALREIWSSVLNVKDVSHTDSFVTLGGSMESASACAARIRQVFNLEVPPSCIHSIVPLRVVAALIDRARLSMDGELVIDCSLFRISPDECQR